jgi:hypothetical protein
MAIQVNKFCSHSVIAKVVKDEKKGTEKQEFTFDWTDLNKRLNNYYAGNDSSYDRIRTNTIASQEQTVKTTVNMIVNILSNALSISLSAGLKELI